MLARCPFVDFDRTGWSDFDDPERSALRPWGRLLRHQDHPNSLFQISLSCQDLDIHEDSMADVPGESLWSFVGEVPALTTSMTIDRAWASLDAAHGPEAWARIEALWRMMQRWMIQAGLDGGWGVSVSREGRLSWRRYRPRDAPAWKLSPRMRALEPVMIDTLLQTKGLLRPTLLSTWTSAPDIHADLPASAHARLELRQQLQAHAEADARLLGLTRDDMDLG